MNLSKVLSTVALVMGVSTALFAGNPKTETKEANPTEAKSENQAAANLVWYKVAYDASHTSGYIPSGTSPIYTGDKTGAEGLDECPDGSAYDCLRGFTSAPSLPTSNTGSDQVKTNEMPQ